MGWLSAAIAFLAVVIAYGQWQTGRHQVVLSLFERRLQVFNDIEDCVKEVIGPVAVSNETFWKFISAKGSARFLFGKDVDEYLAELQMDFAFIKTYTDAVIQAEANAGELMEQKTQTLLRITNFVEKSSSLFGQYMRMDQKMPSRLVS